METTYLPAILSAVLTPNPASVGQEVLISVHAVEIACVPSVWTPTAGEFTAGEV